MNREELNSVLDKHNKWLRGDKGGERADLREANLYEANLIEAKLYGANLRGANLSGANLRGANLYKANLIEAKLYGANLRGANLYGANLRGADLYGADLRGADLRGAKLYGANLREANLYEADIRGAKLRGANLSHCEGIMSFVGEKHLLIYFKTGGEYYFKIGCITKTAKEWLTEFKEIGRKHGYGDSVQIYGEVIKLFSKYDLLEGVKSE